MAFRIFTLVVLVAFSISNTACSSETEHIVKVQGESRVVTKPDIAHCFLKISGEGSSYELSTKAARSKITILGEILDEIFGNKSEISVMKIENKPKGKSYDDIYQKDFIAGMAKAIKGEEPTTDDEKTPKSMLTIFTVYFHLSKFDDDKIIKFRTVLSEKEIAFDKNNPFDFSFDFDNSTSAIYFGLEKPDIHLEKLATESFNNALKKAQIISKGAKHKIAKLANISGCSSELKGSVEISDRSNLTGKDFGPLSIDPNRLMIKFSIYYEFQLTK